MNTWKQSNYTILDRYSLKIGTILIEIESNGKGQWSMECRALGINRVIRNPNVADAQLIAVQDVYDRLNGLSRALPNLKQLAYPEEVPVNIGQLSSQVATGLPASTSLDGCPFHYCDSNPKCEGQCRYDRR